jgi:hypothetical protein
LHSLRKFRKRSTQRFALFKVKEHVVRGALPSDRLAVENVFVFLAFMCARCVEKDVLRDTEYPAPERSSRRVMDE